MKALLALVPWWARALIVLAVVAAFGYVVHQALEHYREQGRAELRPQLVASQAAERQREQETASCVAASKVQSDAITAAAKLASVAQAESARIVASAREQAKQHAARTAELKTLASALPRAQSCEQELAEADAIVSESLKASR